MVAPIEERDPHLPGGERLGGVQSAEAASHDRHVRKIDHVRGCCGEAARARGAPARVYALVFWRTNAWTRFQASAEASANSVCLRSKKLCGAPGETVESCLIFALRHAASNSSTALCGMPASAPPKSESTEHLSRDTAPIGCAR